MKYKTSGVCSRSIDFDVVDNKVTNVHFEGGCSGNTQGVAALIEGMDIDEAIKRNKDISGPANAKRLNLQTPCAKVGYCMDCKSKDRICCEYTVIKRQRNENRIHVIFVNDNLGF